ncbi:DUF2142 domain-containing protein [Butyrivibrio sp. MC2013]|uniref:DUF2142 domain-containing protein n=1 Tax=Butyrivibrio sp. MC2013 TaxID=1280686 RepID=UPI0004098299|nr:DUF2142 domain-containing protein [Butyrivibrio sp. MC2013]
MKKIGIGRIIAVVLVAIAALLIVTGVWKTAYVDKDNRLLMEDDAYSYYYMEEGDYASRVISPVREETKSIHLRLIIRNELGDNASFRAYIFDTNGEIILDEHIPVKKGEKAHNIYEIPVDTALTKGASYQLIIAPENITEPDAMLGIYCLRDTAEPAVSLHYEGVEPYADQLPLVIGLEKILIVLLGAVVIWLLIRGKEGPVFTRQISMLAVFFILLLAYVQYLTDHNIESSGALYLGAFLIAAYFIAAMLDTFAASYRGFIRAFIFISLGIAFIIAVPAGAAADEASHFYRAYQASYGQIFSAVFDNPPNSGGVLPFAVTQFADPGARIDFDNVAEVYFQNTAIYSPACYLPYMIAIRLTALFTDRVMVIFYACRVAGFITATVLSMLALRIIPAGRELLFTVMLMPMALQEAACITGDSLTNSLSFLFMAYIFRLAAEGASLDRKRVIRLSIMGIMISLCKLVYFVFIFLILMIPGNKTLASSSKEARKAYYKDKLIDISLLYVLPLTISMIANVLFGRAYVAFGENMNPADQVKYVLTHVPDTIMTVIRTTVEYLGGWFMAMSGDYLGALDIRTLPFITVTIALMLGFAIGALRLPAGLKNMRVLLVSGLVILAGFLLVEGSIYASWTETGEYIIRGVQGRYLIPFVVPLGIFAAQFTDHPLPLMDAVRMEKRKGMMVLADMVRVFIALLAIVDIYSFVIL